MHFSKHTGVLGAFFGLWVALESIECSALKAFFWGTSATRLSSEVWLGLVRHGYEYHEGIGYH
jgi:hypothetical protein